MIIAKKVTGRDVKCISLANGNNKDNAYKRRNKKYEKQQEKANYHNSFRSSCSSHARKRNHTLRSFSVDL